MKRSTWDEAVDEFVSWVIIVLSVVLLVLGFSKHADAAGTTANVSWTAPDKYTDGVALPPGDIASYTVEWSGTQTGSKTIAGNLTATTVNVPCGGTSFTVYVTLTNTARVPNGVSAKTSPVPYASGVTCQPNPPSALTVS